MNQSFTKWLWIFPVLLALAANLNVLQNGFGWDDDLIINSIKPIQKWWVFFMPGSDLSPKSTHTYYRPVVSVSYALDYMIHGNRPFGFHLSVWLTHALNTGLVFFVARVLMKQPLRVHGSTGSWFTVLSSWNQSNLANNESTEKQASAHRPPLTTHHFIPLISSALFAVHPVHAEAVAWIAGRNDVLCTAFLLLSLGVYMKSRQSGSWILWSVSMISFFLALLTKEAAVFFFLLFPLYEYLVYGSQFTVHGTIQNPKSKIRYIAIRSLPPLLILGLYLLMRSARLATPYGGSSSETLLSGTYLSKVIAAYGYYLKLLILPYPHSPFTSTLPSDSFFLILSSIALVLLGYLLVVGLIRRDMPTTIGLAWTLSILTPAALLPVLGVTPTEAADRYVYAPSAGMILLIVWWITRAMDRVSDTGWGRLNLKILSIVLVIALLGVWTGESWNRNMIWRDSLTFWNAAIMAAPEDGFPYRELGIQYVQQSRYAEAERQYRKSIAAYEKSKGPSHPDVAKTLNSLGVLYYDLGQYHQAGPLYRRALSIRQSRLGPSHLEVAETANNLALVQQALGNPLEAVSLYQQSLVIRERALTADHPDIAQVLNNLAVLYDTEGEYVKAESLYYRALGIREKRLREDHPDIAQTLNNLATLYYSQGRVADAEPLYLKALGIYESSLGMNHPDTARTLNNLAAVYDTLGQYTKAETYYRRSLVILERTFGSDHPAVATSRENYASMLQRIQREGEE